MSSPGVVETHYVRCLKCQKILKCSRYDTSALLEHIRTDHPDIEIVQSQHKEVSPHNSPLPLQPQQQQKQKQQYEQQQQQQKQYSQQKNHQTIVEPTPKIQESQYDFDDNQPLPEITHCPQITYDTKKEREAKVVFTRRYEVHTSLTSPSVQSHRKRSLYRTSIEKWRPASGTIYCPKCGVNKRPLVKTQSERVTSNSCGAACMLACWPFCFLPCLLPGDNKEYLHCANCKNFLGLYDRDHNCIKPNKEYVKGHEAKTQTPRIGK